MPTDTVRTSPVNQAVLCLLMHTAQRCVITTAVAASWFQPVDQTRLRGPENLSGLAVVLPLTSATLGENTGLSLKGT